VDEEVWIELPSFVQDGFEVYVNGIAQVESRDYRRDGRRLVFNRELKKEGSLGTWRWLSMLLGIAGTYRQNDVVDVVYEADGRRGVAGDLSLHRS
jgi:hypothetical protein